MAESAAKKAKTERPKVVFVLGGPGAGKGTQCTKVIENFKSWAHVSAGDCLRAERKDPNSKDGEMINNFIKDGKIVPVAITVKLIMKEMTKLQGEGKTCFLIDGYPRNLDNVTGWEENVGEKAKVCGMLFYEANEAELEKRLLGRDEGRVDDNIESIRKRFKTFMEETMPIVEKFQKDDKVIKIDGMPPAEEVWKITKKTIEDYEAMTDDLEMKVTMKKPAGFYVKSLFAFLKGVEAKPAEGDKEAVEAKPPVDILKISGLGEAINVAIAAATKAEADGCGKITKIETKYPEMTSGRGCAQVAITMERV